MNMFSRFALVPVAAFAAVMGFTSCRGRDAEAPKVETAAEAEPAPEAAEKPYATVPAAEAQSTPAPAGTATEKPVPPAPAPQPRQVEPDVPPASAPSTPQPGPDEPSPEPQIIEVMIPEGTVLELELLTALDSSVNRRGDEIQARTLSPIFVKGEAVLPKGTYVEGRVIEVQASGRVKGRASLAFTFDRMSTRTGQKEIQTSYVDQEADSGQKKDAAVVGGSAGLGAIVGGIIGGKKGAAIGAAIGGAGGTGVVLATKGEEIRLPVGTEVNVRLDEPVVVQLN